MKLIYAYIRKFRNIMEQEISFTDDFRVHYDTGQLSIIKNPKDVAKKIIYGDTVLSDLHIIIGRTGSGKTNLLQLIGMDEQERLSSLKSNDAYMLLYVKPDGNFIAEIVGLDIVGLELSARDLEDRSIFGYDRGRILLFGYDYNIGRIVGAKSVNADDKEQIDRTFIVNGFDRHAFTHCPYRDIRREGIEGSHRFIARYIAPFERTPISLACEFVKEYVEQYPEDSIKRKAALVVRHDEWIFDFLNVDLDQEMVEREYWTYTEKKRDDRMMQAIGRGRPQKYPSAKSCFIHDLMVAYAKYLRCWAAGINPSDARSQGHPLHGLGIENPTLLPDGQEMDIKKRIDWICQYIDYHFDSSHGNRGLVWQIGQEIIEIGNLLGQFDDRYFTDEQFTLPIVDMDFRDGSPLVSLLERVDQYRPDNYGVFGKELLPCHFACLSSGEYQYAKIWGAFDQFCNRIKLASQHNYNHPETHVQPNFILLLDEPETFMHPEMCRQFISRMSGILSKRNPGTSMQVILTTHSPFMLSDVLSSQVTKVDFNEKGECVIFPQSERPYFAANIHTIMADGFFLEYSIGEYARSFLASKYHFLLELAERHPSITTPEWEQVAQIRELLPHIGDEMIRRRFEELLEFMGYA